eukprot:scaffold476337_cov21-Prasinocladus_malaysianus.AAC.1
MSDENSAKESYPYRSAGAKRASAKDYRASNGLICPCRDVVSLIFSARGRPSRHCARRSIFRQTSNTTIIPTYQNTSREAA